MFNIYPYDNLTDLNLDFILKSIRELTKIVKTFVGLNTITFADPIIWNITTQYSPNTVVLDTTGNAYLSKVPVPAGVQLNNIDYWLEIFNFTEYTRTANQNLTVNVETNTTESTHAYNVDDWLIWNDVLYKVTSAIAVGDVLTVDTNIVHFTVEDFIKAFMTWATNTIQQYKNDIDASELQYRQQLAGDIANTTASLQAQLNAAIAGATVDSEVINARISLASNTYATLKQLCDAQIIELYHAIESAVSKSTFNNILTMMPFVQGSIDNSGANTPSTTRIRTDFIPLFGIEELSVTTVVNGNQIRLFYYNDDFSFNSASTWISADSLTINPVSSGYKYMRLLVNTGDVDADLSDVSITMNSYMKEVDTKLTTLTNYIQYAKRSDFEQGGLIFDYGYLNPVTTRIRTIGYLAIDPYFKAQCNSSYQINVFLYDKDFVFIGYSPAVRSIDYAALIAIDTNVKYCKVVLRANDGSQTLTTADFTTADLIIECSRNFVFDKCNLAADIVGTHTASYKIRSNSTKNLIVSICCEVENANCTLSLKQYNQNDDLIYHSSDYQIGIIDKVVCKTFRAPALYNADCYYMIELSVPAASTLHIQYMKVEFDDEIDKTVSGVVLMAHSQVAGAPANTLRAYEMAAKCGYKYMIANLKATSDDYLVCIHDDTPTTTGRNDDGTPLDASYNRPINTFTYNELMVFDFGIYRNVMFKGERIPLLNEFFEICSKSAIHPVLSIHPALTSYWPTIKNLAKRYGLLHRLIIKSTPPILDQIIMPVLGNDIEMYIAEQLNDSTDIVNDVDVAITNNNINKSIVGIEYYYTYITDELITNALANDYVVSCAGVGRSMSNLMNLYKKGVTIFTEDYNTSNALFW